MNQNNNYNLDPVTGQTINSQSHQIQNSRMHIETPQPTSELNLVQNMLQSEITKKNKIKPLIIAVASIIFALVVMILIINGINKLKDGNQDDIKNAPFLMRIKEIDEIRGKGAVVTGIIERGTINQYDEVLISGLCKEKIIAESELLEANNQIKSTATVGDEINLLLKKVDKYDIEIGQVVVDHNSENPTNKFEAKLSVVPTEEGGRHTPFFNEYRPKINFGKDISGIIYIPTDKEMVMPGEEVYVTIVMQESTTIDVGAEFCVREGGRIIANGTVTKVLEESTENDSSNENSTNDENGPFFMRIEDEFTVTGRGTMVTGTIERGKINIGDKVQVIGFDKETITTKVESIQVNKEMVNSAKAGDVVAIFLEDVEKGQAETGQVIAEVNSIIGTKKFEADISVIATEEGGLREPLSNEYNAEINFLIDTSGIIFIPSDKENIMPGENASVTITLSESVGMYVGSEFSIRKEWKTIATGVVTKVYEE